MIWIKTNLTKKDRGKKYPIHIKVKKYSIVKDNVNKKMKRWKKIEK